MTPLSGCDLPGHPRLLADRQQDTHRVRKGPRIRCGTGQRQQMTERTPPAGLLMIDLPLPLQLPGHGTRRVERLSARPAMEERAIVHTNSLDGHNTSAPINRRPTQDQRPPVPNETIHHHNRRAYLRFGFQHRCHAPGPVGALRGQHGPVPGMAAHSRSRERACAASRRGPGGLTWSTPHRHGIRVGKPGHGVSTGRGKVHEVVGEAITRVQGEALDCAVPWARGRMTNGMFTARGALALQLPTPPPPLRTQGRTLPRFCRHRSSPDRIPPPR